MTRRLNVLAAKSDGLRSIPRTQMVEGENGQMDFHKLSSDSHMPNGAHVGMHMQTQSIHEYKNIENKNQNINLARQ